MSVKPTSEIHANPTTSREERDPPVSILTKCINSFFEIFLTPIHSTCIACKLVSVIIRQFYILGRFSFVMFDLSRHLFVDH